MSNSVEYILRLRDQFTPTMSKATAGTRTLNTSMKATTGTAVMMGRAIKSALGPITAIFAAGQLIKSVYDLGTGMEQTEIAFSVMTGSMKRAKGLIGELQQFANRTPYDNDALQKQAKVLLQFGREHTTVISDIRMLGDIASGNKEKLRALTLAYSQASSAGRLMGQDLLQMINAGFNPLMILAKEQAHLFNGDLQKAYQHLRDEMSKGNISMDQVTHAFKSATQEGGLFYGMMDKQSQTVSGRMSTLVGKLQMLGIRLGKALLPVFKGLTEGGIFLVDLIQSIDYSPLKEMFQIGKEIYTTFGAMFREIAEVFGLTNSEFDLMHTLGKGLSLVVRAMVFPTKMLWTAFKSLLQISKNIVQAFGGLGKAIKGLVTWDFDLVKKGVKESLAAQAKAFGTIKHNAKKLVYGEVKGFMQTLNSDPATTAAQRAQNTTSAALANQAAANTAAGGGRAGSRLSNSISGASSGTTNIDFRIESLIKDVSFVNNNYKQNKAELMDMLREGLITMLNDVQTVSR
jgi:tape measure domain-containing protein